MNEGLFTLLKREELPVTEDRYAQEGVVQVSTASLSLIRETAMGANQPGRIPEGGLYRPRLKDA